MKATKIILLVIVLALLMTAAAHLNLVEIIKHYPQIFAGNTAGCQMNWDLGWYVVDSSGKVHNEPGLQSAILNLVSCD